MIRWTSFHSYNTRRRNKNMLSHNLTFMAKPPIILYWYEALSKTFTNNKNFNKNVQFKKLQKEFLINKGFYSK